MTALATTLQVFFTDRLIRQRQVSRIPAQPIGIACGCC
jgi:hypothetical protein